MIEIKFDMIHVPMDNRKEGFEEATTTGQRTTSCRTSIKGQAVVVPISRGIVCKGGGEGTILNPSESMKALLRVESLPK